MLRKILFCAVGALLFAGCSDDDTSGVVLDLDSPIRATVSLSDPDRSRSGIVNAGLAFDASLFRVDATGAAYPSGYEGIAALPAAVSADGSLTMTPEQYYQVNGDNTALLGVYPAVGSGGTWSASAGTVKYVVDGKTDVMATTFASSNKDSAQPALVFGHLLTQIHVSVYAQDQNTINLWGDVQSVAIVGCETECTLTLPAPGQADAVATAFSGTANDLLLTAADGTAAAALEVTAIAKADAQSFGYCMFAPVASKDLVLQIATSVGGINTVTLPSVTFEKGKAYDVAIQMVPTGFILSDNVTITEWESGTTIGPIDGEMI